IENKDVEVPTGNGGFSVYCAEGASLRTSIPEGAPEGSFHHSSRWLFSYMLNVRHLAISFFRTIVRDLSLSPVVGTLLIRVK
ncbi:hypothetical protein V1478_003596, partial [Vespula squamosa]